MYSLCVVVCCISRPAPVPVPRIVLRAHDAYRMLVVRSRVLYAIPDPFHMLRESEVRRPCAMPKRAVLGRRFLRVCICVYV